MIKLFAQLAFVDHVGEANGFGAVDEREGHVGVGLVAEDRLAHQQLVEIRVDEGPHDGVHLPAVVVDAGGDIDHGGPPGINPAWLNQSGDRVARNGYRAARLARMSLRSDEAPKRKSAGWSQSGPRRSWVAAM